MKTTVIVLTSIIFAASSSAWAGGTEVEHYSVGPDAGLPFSDAVRVGNMLYLSGKIGNIPGTRDLAEGGIAGETRQSLENIKTSLEKYGSSMNEVIKCTVFLADIDEWAAMNEVYKTYFPVNPPARSALGASGLALNSRVEIECFAAMRD
jgi:reactive intermediate/imine deaminase